MLSKTGQLKSKEEAIEYNQKIWKFRAESTYTACISTLACEHCYALISDSICLCIGNFTCPNCDKENGRKIPLIQDISQSLTLKPVDWIQIPPKFFK
jgi:hypothetical protein